MPALSRLVGRLWQITPHLQIAPAAGHLRPNPDLPVPRVVVIGAGIAGMTAATILAERGATVTVCEAAERAGGRLSAEPHQLSDGTTQWVDHGFHGFFRQYYNWRAILARTGNGVAPLHPLGSYPVISHRWPAEEFDGLPPTPPVSMLALLARSPSLRLRDLRRVDPDAARCLLGFDGRQTYRSFDHVTAEDLLASLQLPERARSMLFNVFAHSFFNDAGSMSAADLIAMFHFYFLANPEGLGMDAPRVDYQTGIWAPMQARLTSLGAHLRYRTPVSAISQDVRGSWRVHTATSSLAAEHVVLALDAASAGTVLANSPQLIARDERLGATAHRPFVGPPYAVARFWLSGDVDAARAPFTSIGDPQVLDSVTLYHRLEQQSMGWHRRSGGAVLELHAYACPDGVPAEMLGATMRAELTELWPELRRLSVVDQRCRVGHDAAGFPAGGHLARPGVRTALPGLTLAGDWVGVPVPSALMERAATTGMLAANRILSAHGLPVEPIWSVPPRGLLTSRSGAKRRGPVRRARSLDPVDRAGGLTNV